MIAFITFNFSYSYEGSSQFGANWLFTFLSVLGLSFYRVAVSTLVLSLLVPHSLSSQVKTRPTDTNGVNIYRISLYPDWY